MASYQDHPAIIGLMQDITDKQVADEQIKHYYEQLQNSFLQTVELATTMGEMRDPYTAGHELRMYSIAIKSRGSYLPFPSCANCDSFDIMLNRLKGYIPHRTPCALPTYPTPPHALYPTPCGNAIRHALCPCGNAMTYTMPYAYAMLYAGIHHAPCPMPRAMPYALIVDCDSFDIMLNRMSKKVMGLRLNRGKPVNRC